MKQQIKRVGRELKYKGVIVNVYADAMEMPDGRMSTWDFVEHPRGASAVVPVMPDGKILMVRQFRNALDRETLEIPAGARDSKEEAFEVCAARELEEETGYRCGKLEYLLTLNSTVALFDEEIGVFVAHDLIPSEQHLDPDEYVELETHSLEELEQWIYDGKIRDGKTVAGIMAYKNKYR